MKQLSNVLVTFILIAETEYPTPKVKGENLYLAHST